MDFGVRIRWVCLDAFEVELPEYEEDHEGDAEN